MTTAGSLVERARSRATERAWRTARELFLTADAQERLALEDLERLALAAYLSGDSATATEAWTRAMRSAAEAGDSQRAAQQAIRIGADLAFRGDSAPAMGWFGRAGTLVADRPECAEHAWLRTFGAVGRMFGGDPAGARPIFADGVTAGRRFGDRDLETLSQLGHGQCLILQGQVPAGLGLLDELMVSVIAGEVSPLYAGIAYCAVIATCWQIFELRRARQWTVALTRWCDAQPDLVPFRGNCLIHRSELDALRGDWSDAQDLAREACDQLSGPLRWDSLGAAHYQLAEVQRLRGDFRAAEEGYRRAADAGRSPEPGLALLRLAEGRVDTAAAMLRRALDETSDPPDRARLLPAHVEVSLASGDVSAARQAVEEMAEIAALLDSPYLHALADGSTGAVLLAEGDARAALPRLRAAAGVWRELEAQRETARTRALIGLACRALGDEESAAMELDGAHRVFERLGAGPDLTWLGEVQRPRAGTTALTGRELEVLRLVAAGETNRAIATTLAISEKTVARHLSNIFSKIDVTSRAAATAYAYVHRLL